MVTQAIATMEAPSCSNISTIFNSMAYNSNLIDILKSQMINLDLLSN